MVYQSYSRGLGLLFAAIALLASSAQGLDCHKCKTNNPQDSCFTRPSSVSRTSCLPGIQKCIIRRTFDTSTNTVTEFERDCELTVPFFGGKTACERNGNIEECQVACDEDMCNDVREADVVKCVQDQCRSGASLPVAATMSILMVTSAVAILH